MIEPSLGVISEAFSRTAEKYDAFAVDHPHQARMRNKVYAYFTRLVPPDSRLLELNSGTGTDAVELAGRGYSVHATDIAPGMLDRLRAKVDELGLHDRITVEERSFLSLSDVPGAPFDAVFSDLRLRQGDSVFHNPLHGRRDPVLLPFTRERKEIAI